jgi:hypothetical protein
MVQDSGDTTYGLEISTREETQQAIDLFAANLEGFEDIFCPVARSCATSTSSNLRLPPKIETTFLDWGLNFSLAKTFESFYLYLSEFPQSWAVWCNTSQELRIRLHDGIMFT